MPLEVHGHDQVPVFLGHGGEHAVAIDAGVVHHGVQVAKTFQRLLHCVEAGIVVGDIGGIHHGLAAGRNDFRHHFGRGLRVDIVHHHAGTLGRQYPRMGRTQPTTGAGDDHYPAFTYSAHIPVPVVSVAGDSSTHLLFFTLRAECTKYPCWTRREPIHGGSYRASMRSTVQQGYFVHSPLPPFLGFVFIGPPEPRVCRLAIRDRFGHGWPIRAYMDVFTASPG